MDGLLQEPTRQRRPFRGFGPTSVAYGRAALHGLGVSAKDPVASRQAIRQRCPTRPGVYGIIDSDEHLIYVGVSKQLRQRLLSYFTGSDDSSKQHRIAEHARRLVWETAGHALTAQLRELELIRRWRPRFNAVGRPRRQRLGYIYLTATDAPQFRAGNLPARHCRQFWGPVPLGWRMRDAVERLNHVFRLRTCSQGVPTRFADQLDLFDMDRRAACLRGDVGGCLAPCAGQCTHSQYTASIDTARALLDGGDLSILDRLQAEMIEAAAANSFERAAMLRDARDELAYLVEQIQWLRDVRQHYWFVYPVPGNTGRTVWKLIAGGDLAAVVREPVDDASRHRCRQMLDRVFHHRDQLGVEQVGDLGQMRTIASWFRRYPDQMQQVLDIDQAWHRCVGRLGPIKGEVLPDRPPSTKKSRTIPS
jgi:excinuclease ABC subunit C